MAGLDTTYFDLNSNAYSLASEQGILGGILIEPESIATVLNYITTAEMFMPGHHQKLYEVLLNMFNSSNNDMDFITVTNEAVKSSVFPDEASAKAYLFQLMEGTPNNFKLDAYCSIVQEKYYLRSLITVCNEINAVASENDAEANALLALAEQRIYDIRKGRSVNGLVKIDEAIILAYDRLFQVSSEDSEYGKSLSTGFQRLDMVMGGLNDSDLIIVAGRPGMGKSSFAMNIALNVARRNRNVDVAVFSLEMSKEQLVLRALASEALVHNEKLREGKLSDEEWAGLASMSDILSQTQMYFDDTAGTTVAEIKAKLQRLPNVGLVVIDYLQLMSTGGAASNNRVNEISTITRSMKMLAKDLHVPVILLSQLSRASEQRADHTPILSDLRDSGSIEQDADIILFLTRDAYYDKEAEDLTKAQCVVAKNRHGQTGNVELRWLGEYTRYENVEYYHEENH